MTHPGGDEGRREGLVGEERVDPKVLATAEVLDLVALLPALHAVGVQLVVLRRLVKFQHLATHIKQDTGRGSLRTFLRRDFFSKIAIKPIDMENTIYTTTYCSSRT